MDWRAYSDKSASAVMGQLDSGKKGLSSAAAHKRLKQNGPNRLPHAHGSRLISFTKSLCTDTFFILLLAGLAISLYLGNSYAVWALVVVIALHGVAQWVYLSKNYRFITQLEALLARQVAVIRGGKQLQIDSGDLVVGDIVCLEYGDTVPADVKLVETERFATDDFTLPEDKNSHIKHTASGDSSVVFMGTAVVSGSARGVVIATGKGARIGQLVGSGSTIQALTGVPARGLSLLRTRLGWIAAILVAALVIVSLLGHQTLQEFWTCPAVLIVAAVPTELVAALTLSHRTMPASPERITACATHNVSAKLGLATVSIFGLLVFHVPLAVTIVGLLIIDIIGSLLPASSIDADAKTPADRLHLVGFGLFAAGLSYASFLFYFESRSLSPAYIDTGSTLYFRAAMLACLVIILCQFVSVFMIRASEHKHFFTRHIHSNTHLLVAFTLAFAGVLFITYSPLTHHYLRSGALNVSDWGTAVLAAAIYTCFRLLQRHTRHHTRRALLRDHSPEALRRHPKLA